MVAHGAVLQPLGTPDHHRPGHPTRPEGERGRGVAGGQSTRRDELGRSPSRDDDVPARRRRARPVDHRHHPVDGRAARVGEDDHAGGPGTGVRPGTARTEQRRHLRIDGSHLHAVPGRRQPAPGTAPAGRVTGSRRRRRRPRPPPAPPCAPPPVAAAGASGRSATRPPVRSPSRPPTRPPDPSPSRGPTASGPSSRSPGPVTGAPARRSSRRPRVPRRCGYACGRGTTSAAGRPAPTHDGSVDGRPGPPPRGSTPAPRRSRPGGAGSRRRSAGCPRSTRAPRSARPSRTTAWTATGAPTPSVSFQSPAGATEENTVPPVSGPSNDGEAIAPGSTGWAPGTTGVPGEARPEGRRASPPPPAGPSTSARCGTHAALANTVMPVPDSTGWRSSWASRAGSRSAGTGYAGGTLLTGDLGGEGRQHDHVADPGRGDQVAHAVGLPLADHVDGVPEIGGGTGTGPVPQPAGVGRTALGGGVGQSAPGVPSPLVQAARVGDPQDPERPVRRLGPHPGHRLPEVVGGQVPAARQGRHQGREGGHGHRQHPDHGDQLAPAELGLGQVPLEGRHPQTDRRRGGRRRRPEEYERIDGQSARPPPSDDPRQHPQEQRDSPEAGGPAEPDPPGEQQRCRRGDQETPGQRRTTDGAGGEAEQLTPGRRPRGRGLESEHRDHPPPRGEHPDEPGQADHEGDQGRSQGQTQRPGRGPHVTEQDRGDDQGDGGHDHDDGRRGHEGDQHGLQHAQGERSTRADRGATPTRPRTPAGPPMDRRTAWRRTAPRRSVRRAPARWTGPGPPGRTGHRHRRSAPPTDREPARCRPGAWRGRPVRPPGRPVGSRTAGATAPFPTPPRGRQPKISTFWASPIDPARMVPSTAVMASPGAAGAVVPTPDGCQPPKNSEKVDDHDGNGVNCPTAGRRPDSTPRDPITTRSAAMSHTATRTWLDTRPASVDLRPGLQRQTLRGRAVGLGRHRGGGRQFVGVGSVEAVLEHATPVGRESGTPPHLEQADLLVAESAPGLQFRPPGPGQWSAGPGSTARPAPRPGRGCGCPPVRPPGPRRPPGGTPGAPPAGGVLRL